MKKHFIMLFTILSIGGVLLTGCGSEKTSDLPEQTPAIETPALEQSTSKPPTEEVPNTAQPEASTKPQTSKPNTSKPEASKPITKPEKTQPIPTPEATPETPLPEVSSLSASEIYDKVLSDLEIPRQNTLDDTMLKDWYGIDASILKSYKVTMPLMSSQINEYAVFEVKDSKDVQTVLDGIEKRTEGMFLYPSLQEAFDARQTVTKGNYILFVIDGEAVDTIVKNFNALIK
ncbi:hypothetical protein CS063_12690 [Sporanaerobium hydrogeniformans]|uniref:Uncharacterized protein n=1 Tax=Sporanaerobium hydrogeniformans TaxID=3072179 RepID=A0AC61DB64_9FIRM|nr:DUF4358 domain-containing protein [Sporanaerobium hydrogeniformans]PHV69998.1 hypothetical protein CS063_12690 [Sporanaerobium hydrogeniformans]